MTREVSKVSNEDLQDVFTEAYEKQVASLNGIGEFECICNRDISSSQVRMEVTVTGLAGTPTVDDFKDGKISNADVVIVDDDDKGYSDNPLRFELDPKETISLNTNDYMAVYNLDIEE